MLWKLLQLKVKRIKSLVSKIEKIAGYVAEAQLPSEEKKEAWLDSNQLAEALGISTRTLQRLRDENLISYSMLRGRCYVQAVGGSNAVWKSVPFGASLKHWRIFARTT